MLIQTAQKRLQASPIVHRNGGTGGHGGGGTHRMGGQPTARFGGYSQQPTDRFQRPVDPYAMPLF
jgi:hypothetical protein